MKLPPAAADTILLYSLFKKSDEGKPSCDFTNQKVWILIWATLNILAVVGLLVALGITIITTVFSNRFSPC